jgi:hypothetical protein
MVFYHILIKKINREEKLINEPQEVINKYNDLEKSIIENVNLKEDLKIDISEIRKRIEKNLGYLKEKNKI